MSNTVNLLGNPITKDYVPGYGYVQGSPFVSLQRYPPFRLQYVRDMTIDSKVQFGLYLIAGSILSKGSYKVESENDDIGEYVTKTLDAFKLSGMEEALSCLPYGYACSEPLYESKKGRICYKEIKFLNPMDCRPLRSAKTGNIAGAAVRINQYDTTKTGTNGRVLLGGPKALWTVHSKASNPWYGLSRLYHAYYPWLEKWSDGGSRDIRKLFFYKYAYTGGDYYHPPGSIQLDDDGSGQPRTILCRDLARQIAEQSRTGGINFFPNTTGSDGKPAWYFNPIQMGGSPEAIFTYGEKLDIEILEGMGIPNEVVQAPGNSSGGWAGRSVPMDAFCAILHTTYGSIISEFVKQVIHPLVILNFGYNDTEFTVKPYGLLTENDQVDQQMLDQEQPGQQPSATQMSLRVESSWDGYIRRNRLRDSFAIEGGGLLNYAA